MSVTKVDSADESKDSSMIEMTKNLSVLRKNNEKEEDHKYDIISLKILLIGQSAVGKSAILQRYVDNEYNNNFISTIGVDFRTKTLIFDRSELEKFELGTELNDIKHHGQEKENYDDSNTRNTTVLESQNFTSKVKVKIQLWDTAGQERFRSITSNYYKNAHGIILLYDVTEYDSFVEASTNWLAEVERYAPEEIVTIWGGNKIDSKSEIDQKIHGLCKERMLNLDHLYVSARTGENVKELFDKLIKKIITKQGLNKLIQDSSQSLNCNNNHRRNGNNLNVRSNTNSNNTYFDYFDYYNPTNFQLPSLQHIQYYCCN